MVGKLTVAKSRRNIVAYFEKLEEKARESAEADEA